MKRNVGVVCFLAAFMLSLLSIFSCDEVLPARNDPSQLFTTSLSWVYDFSRSNNGYIIKFILKNNYSEAIQAKAAIDGELTIEWLIDRMLIGEISTIRTAKLTNANLNGSPLYDGSKGILTIPSGASVTLWYYWNLKTDDSTTIYMQPAFNGSRKYNCQATVWVNGVPASVSRWFFCPQAYRVSGYVRLFEQTAHMHAPEMKFSSCYIYPYVDPYGSCEIVRDPQRSCELYYSLP
ncbi:MAG: hypothetical protein NTV54_09255 [Ignavibacteriales bacterium]|nr:hypothetical protein [Ignavibacteriales bacterium]